MRRRVAALIFALCFVVPASAGAHLATFGSWRVTRDYLGKLFPGANHFLVKKHQFDDKQVARIEKKLGFDLYPEDRTPTFYVAVAKKGGKKKFLGVAMFVDPRVKPKILDGAALRLEVGVAVDARGHIARMRVFDYRGDLALTKPKFLDQFHGMLLDDEFDLKKNDHLHAVSGEEKESQLVADAGREALYLMKISLGRH